MQLFINEEDLKEAEESLKHEEKEFAKIKQNKSIRRGKEIMYLAKRVRVSKVFHKNKKEIEEEFKKHQNQYSYPTNQVNQLEEKYRNIYLID